jgi:hypothetical protein
MLPLSRRTRLAVAATVLLLLPACGGEPTAADEATTPSAVEFDSVQVQALALHVAPAEDGATEVRSGVRLTNRSGATRDVGLEFTAPSGRCGSLELYHDARLVGTPAWSVEQWLLTASRGRCPAVLPVYTLAPGEIREVPVRYPLRLVLGDSLRPGRYHARLAVKVVPQLSARLTRSAILAAGSADLPVR